MLSTRSTALCMECKRSMIVVAGALGHVRRSLSSACETVCPAKQNFTGSCSPVGVKGKAAGVRGVEIIAARVCPCAHAWRFL